MIGFMTETFKTVLFATALALSAADTTTAAETSFADQKFKATPWSQDWSVGVHWGQTIENNVRSLDAFNPFKIGYLDYSLVSLGLRKKIANYGPYFSLYSELNVSHIYGDEDYNEVFFTPTISWDYFPWDKVLNTSASIGVGLSYTSIESNLDNSGKKLMASMIFELEFKLPEYEKVALFTRIHHRSTAGIFAAGGGSNFHAIGLRYYLD